MIYYCSSYSKIKIKDQSNYEKFYILKTEKRPISPMEEPTEFYGFSLSFARVL